VDVNNSAFIIVPILEEKLPSRVRGNIAETDTADVFNLDTFLSAFKKQVERYEAENQVVDLDADRPKPIFESTEGLVDNESVPMATCRTDEPMCYLWFFAAFSNGM
jgi:hypothetical protein